MSRIGLTTNLDIACHFLGYQQIQVTEPPTNGRVFTKHLSSEYPTFPSASDHAHCDALKRPAVEILYEANPGFSGTDSFRIMIIDQNHVPYLKPYTVQVQ